MTSTQVVGTSVIDTNFVQDFPNLDNHTTQT